MREHLRSQSAGGAAHAEQWPSAPPTGPAGAACLPPLSRQARFGQLFALVWLMYLAYPLVDLFGRGTTPLQRVVGVAALCAFVAVYVWAWSGRDGWASRRAPRGLAAVFTIGAASSLYLGAAWVGLFIFGASLGARMGSDRSAAGAILVNTAASAAIMASLHVGLVELLTLSGTAAIVGFGTLAMRRLAATSTDLIEAREEIARLAAVDERVRIARDVHDLLGHSLAVIALKADLAGRLMSADPSRAAAEVADIQSVARRSLSEVREAVAGYRRPRLQEELSRARAGLEAAGIRCEIALQEGELPELVDGVLAWVVREGATNVLKHSGARTCRIYVQRRGPEAVVTVEDDGRGAAVRPGGGSGLVGLHERVRQAGGSLRAEPVDSTGFRLEAALPADVGAHGAGVVLSAGTA